MCSAFALLLATRFGAAQSPYGQLGGGGGIGAHYSSGSTDRGVFPTAALSGGLGWRSVLVRADVRAFATEAEALMTVGLTLSTSLHRSAAAELYLLAGGGGGLFVAEGDPGQHVGAGIGLTNHRSPGFYTELRYDYLVGTFTYASRTRSLISLIAGVRVGPRRSS